MLGDACPELDAFDFDLPADRIAQAPPADRDGGRLLHLHGEDLKDRCIRDLPDMLNPGDLVVVNDSRVMAARCLLHRSTGGAVEVLFLAPGPGPVEALLRPARRLAEGERLLGDGIGVLIRERRAEGIFLVEAEPSPMEVMARVGRTPLPPYIHRAAGPADGHRYQTIFAGPLGSAAAPTAGLHLSRDLLARLDARGVSRVGVTLHVGLGTFRPIGAEDLARDALHPESFDIPVETAARIAATRADGGRVIAVGTTTVRALESATPPGLRTPVVGPGMTRLFIREGYAFRAIDGMLTNFHLPRSSLLMLVSALAGRERVLGAYRHAVERGYRFYSYGDAMLVL